MPAKSKKGGKFERYFSEAISLWYSHGEADDWFWRASQSGGRATRRARVKKTTAGHYGDIAACNPQAARLLEVVTIELKVGYNAYSIQDHLDAAPTMADQLWNQWIEQVQEAAETAQTPQWFLVTRRDQRQALITIPNGFWRPISQVAQNQKIWLDPIPCIRMRWNSNTNTITFPLQFFFDRIEPEWVHDANDNRPEY